MDRCWDTRSPFFSRVDLVLVGCWSINHMLDIVPSWSNKLAGHWRVVLVKPCCQLIEKEEKLMWSATKSGLEFRHPRQMGETAETAACSMCRNSSVLRMRLPHCDSFHGDLVWRLLGQPDHEDGTMLTLMEASVIFSLRIPSASVVDLNERHLAVGPKTWSPQRCFIFSGSSLRFISWGKKDRAQD